MDVSGVEVREDFGGIIRPLRESGRRDRKLVLLDLFFHRKVDNDNVRGGPNGHPCPIGPKLCILAQFPL